MKKRSEGCFCFLSIFAALFIFCASPIFADPLLQSEATLWSDFFSANGSEIGLQGISKSGDPNEDDMTVFISQGKSKIPIPISLETFDLVGFSSNLESLSKKVPVFKIGSSIILFVLFPNNRPNFSNVTLVAYDFNSKSILDFKENIGALKDGDFVFISEGLTKFKTRLVKEYIGSIIKSDGPEAHIEDWMTVSFSNGKISYRWKE